MRIFKFYVMALALILMGMSGVNAQTYTFESSNTWDSYGITYPERTLTVRLAPSSICFALQAPDNGTPALREVSFEKGRVAYDSYGGDYSRTFTLLALDEDGGELLVWSDLNYGYVKFVNRKDSAKNVACDLTKEDANRIFDLVEREVKRMGMKKMVK
jgi:hypothetical protein